MTFYDVISDIKKMVGLNLQSIRPGSNVTIIDVDDEHENIILQTSQGSLKSRPIGELQKIWNELNRSPAVHVDGVLNGSGSSRNQPETVIANLPYIEWLQLNGKKHISFVAKNTHAFGTLKKMDAIAVQEIIRRMAKKADTTKAFVIVVTDELSSTISALQAAFTGTVSALEKGVYSFESSSLQAIVVASTRVALEVGTYPVISSSSQITGRMIKLQGEEYYCIGNYDLRLLAKKQQ